MEELNDDCVVLNIYELTPQSPPQTSTATSEGQEGQNSSSLSSSIGSGLLSFCTRMLPHAGFGAYHTSIDVNGYCYTYGSGGGIGKTKVTNKHSHVPANAKFIESISLGQLHLDRRKINECITRLRRSTFTGTSYHLLNRNCNHFTETFATILIIGNNIANESPPTLNKYPKWVNRLAKSGTTVINHGDVCDVLNEARYAIGVEDKVGWDLPSSNSEKYGNTENTLRSQRKELTEAQKKILSKLKSKK